MSSLLRHVRGNGTDLPNQRFLAIKPKVSRDCGHAEGYRDALAGIKKRCNAKELSRGVFRVEWRWSLSVSLCCDNPTSIPANRHGNLSRNRETNDAPSFSRTVVAFEQQGRSVLPEKGFGMAGDLATIEPAGYQRLEAVAPAYRPRGEA